MTSQDMTHDTGPGEDDEVVVAELVEDAGVLEPRVPVVGVDPQYVDLYRRLRAEGGVDLQEQLHNRYLQLARGGVTAGGLPWPSPTDPVAEGADAIRALAEAVEARFRQVTGRAGNAQASLASGTAMTTIALTNIESVGMTFADNGFTLGYSGMYVLAGDIFLPSAASGAVQIAVYVNESVGSGAPQTSPLINGVTNRVSVATVRRLAAGSLITLRAFQNSGAALTVADAHLTLVRIS